MFRHHGPGRSEKQNRLLAGYLAFVGGFVNSAGFLLIGSFTSHVTGNVGRLANDLASSQFAAAAAALTMVAAFFAGAFVASMAIESSFFGRAANAYGVALLAEATLLVVFMIVSNVGGGPRARVLDMEAAILCVAMGIQNSLVTRLSGAVVRTTHLTGVITDLGIEGARWFRWWRVHLSKKIRVTLSFGRNPPEKPASAKVGLLATIALSFSLGAVCGAATCVRLAQLVMVIPTLALVACAIYAFASARPTGATADTRR